MRGLLQVTDEKREASLTELSAKHQKVHLHADTHLYVFVLMVG